MIIFVCVNVYSREYINLNNQPGVMTVFKTLVLNKINQQ